jgi:hypothetical protein
VAEFLEVPFTSRPYEEKQEIKKTGPGSENTPTYHTVYEYMFR